MAESLWHAPLNRKLIANSFWLTLEKSFNYAGIFVGHDGASCVEQNAAGFKQWPEAVRNVDLDQHKSLNVFGRALEFYIWMAANNTGGGTGRVEQYAVTLITVPPLGRLTRVTTGNRGRDI